MSTAPPIIVWFRRDLRLADNPALAAAAATGRPLVAVYIYDEGGSVRPMGAASRWWLDKSLRSLSANIEAKGNHLILRKGDRLAVLRALVAETGAWAVYWNRLYEPGEAKDDAETFDQLTAAGLECRTFNAAALNEPGAIRTGAGGGFKVFTPYWRAARALTAVHTLFAAPALLTPLVITPASQALDDWSLHPSRPDWSGGFFEWTPGEAGARDRLEVFLRGAARHYRDGRDHPARPGTSKLSPHLHFGEIGPRQVWAAARDAGERGDAPEAEVEAFQRELFWREFNYDLLAGHPDMTRRNLQPRFDGFEWRKDENAFRAWTRGRTGYPIVDAAMRQLWSTGWMHNRARMIVASFLVKDLLIDWRRGEAWFWDTLIDADLANNIANWQWVAGSGADAAPYFRVFNPTLQGEKFDADGAYVHRWAPELAGLGPNMLHKPWRADAETLKQAGVELGVGYPRPIVDHGLARERALAIYARMP